MRRFYEYAPVEPTVDLRTMVRKQIMGRSIGWMEQARARRAAIVDETALEAYLAEVRAAVRAIYGSLPVGPDHPVASRIANAYDCEGYHLKNVLFESWPGWEVNATIYIPTDFDPPYPAVVVPVGHTGNLLKVQASCQVFARCGYLAIFLDSSEQADEKQTGNDPWRDGARSYLLGRTSSRFFVVNALRCIDYLNTRDDVDLSRGVAMTGVSGGGKTAALASALDSRVTVRGPCCCLAPIGEADVAMALPPCPETFFPGRFPAMLDDTDILLAGYPAPTYLLAGLRDTLRTPERMHAVYEELLRVYSVGRQEDRIDIFFDDAPHIYTVTMALQFVGFMNRWLLGQPTRPVPDIHPQECVPDHYEPPRTFPQSEVNMFTICREEGRDWANARRQEAASDRTTPGRLQAGLQTVIGLGSPPASPPCAASKPYETVMEHLVAQELLLQPEPGIELPGTFFYPVEDAQTIGGALLFFDDKGRWDLLQGEDLTHFLAAGAARPMPYALLSADLRGWGDTAPAPVPTDVYSWTHPTRDLAYLSAALGDPVLAMRVRDGSAWLAYLRARLNVEVPVIVAGRGMGGVVALHVAALDSLVSGVYAQEMLASFQSLLEEPRPTWPHDAYLPSVLKHYDLPELAASLELPTLLALPLNGRRNPLAREEAEATYARALQRPLFSLHVAEQADGLYKELIAFCEATWQRAHQIEIARSPLAIVRPPETNEMEQWARMRMALWPDCPADRHHQEMEETLRNPQAAILVGIGADGYLQGFVEASIRAYAEGCRTRTVGYLEGWYVEPLVRQQGIGRALVMAAEKWARTKGCTEMASDTSLDNRASQLAHERLGYRQTEKLVHFRKDL